MTKIIPITNPDYGPNPNYVSWLWILITESGLRIWDYGSRTTDLDYESELRIWITDPDYEWTKIHNIFTPTISHVPRKNQVASNKWFLWSNLTIELRSRLNKWLTYFGRIRQIFGKSMLCFSINLDFLQFYFYQPNHTFYENIYKISNLSNEKNIFFLIFNFLNRSYGRFVLVNWWNAICNPATKSEGQG